MNTNPESSVVSSIQDLMLHSSERVIEDKQRMLQADKRVRQARRRTFARARRTRRLCSAFSSHPESSVVSSIQDLMLVSSRRVIEDQQRKLETERRVRRARRRTFAAARRTRRARKEAEERRLQTETDRHEQEQAHLSAMHIQTVTAARAEVEQRGRAQISQLELDHRERLADMERSSNRWELRVALVLFVSVLLALGGGAALVIHDMTVHHDEEVATLQSELASSQEQSDAQADAQAGELNNLDEQLSSLRDDLDAARTAAKQARADADRASTEAAAAKIQAKKTWSAPRWKVPVAEKTTTPAVDCDPQDPLCGFLPL